MTTTFTPQPGTEKLIQPLVVDALEDVAEQAAEESRRIAPVRTGAYRASIKAESDFEGGKAIARVNAFDYKAWWIEAGTEDTPTFAPLARGAEAAGLILIAEVHR